MPTIAIVKSEGLHLRAKPVATSESIDELTTGDRIEVDRTTTRAGEWLFGQVAHTKSGDGVGERGWFHSRYTRLTETPDDFPHVPDRIDPDKLMRAAEWPWVIAAFVVAVGVAALIYIL